MTTMAFITHYSKKWTTSCRAWLLLAAILGLTAGHAWAVTGIVEGAPEPNAPNTPALKLDLERADGAIFLSAQIKFELPAVVEDALQKGIPIYFVAQVDVLRERWYWINRKVTSVQRRMRLAYHPLTRRWRFSQGSGDMTEDTLRLVLSQNFETLGDALATVRRISRWKIAEATDIEPTSLHLVRFSFALDTSQLPRPLQIGTLGQADWLIEVAGAQVLDVERIK